MAREPHGLIETASLFGVSAGRVMFCVDRVWTAIGNAKAATINFNHAVTLRLLSQFCEGFSMESITMISTGIAFSSCN